MSNIFRTLRPDEIDVRVQQIKKNKKGDVYAMLLLYKDARVDMTLLDEEFGIFGWQREHNFKDGKNYCIVSVQSPSGYWVIKEDVGVPSNTEADKGQASDAFKRACVNLGIGRELYSSPRLIIELTADEFFVTKDARGAEAIKLSNGISFNVAAIEYDERRNISGIVIKDNKGRIRKQVGSPKNMDVYCIEEMNSCQTKHDAQAIWRKYPEFQTEPRFLSAWHMKIDQINNKEA